MSQSPATSPQTTPPSSPPMKPQIPITPLATQLTRALNLGPGTKAPPRRPLNDNPIKAPDSLSAKGKNRSSLGAGLGLPPPDQDIDETMIDMGEEGGEKKIDMAQTPVRTLDFVGGAGGDEEEEVEQKNGAPKR